MKLGTAASIHNTFPYIRPGLMQALQASAPPREVKASRIFHGKREAKPERNPGEDQLILEIRRLYEQEHKKLLEIHLIVGRLGFMRTKSWVHQTTQYHNRSHLVPTAGAAPYLELKT